MPFVVSQGRKIYYERHGQGPALLFCHGAGSNAATWWQQLNAFSRDFTCITMDLRCFGRSAAPLDEFAFECFVPDALAVLDAENIERAGVIGQSLGGMIGLRLALQHADRIWAFVASDTSLAVDHALLLEIMRQRVTVTKALTVEQRSLGRWFLEHHPDRAALYMQINHFNPSAHAFTPQEWGAAMQGLIAPRNLLPVAQLAQVQCPTLFIVGSEDPLVPVSVVQEFQALVAHSEVHVVQQAGHSAYFEKPQEFNENVLAFLKRHTAA